MIYFPQFFLLTGTYSITVHSHPKVLTPYLLLTPPQHNHTRVQTGCYSGPVRGTAVRATGSFKQPPPKKKFFTRKPRNQPRRPLPTPTYKRLPTPRFSFLPRSWTCCRHWALDSCCFVHHPLRRALLTPNGAASDRTKKVVSVVPFSRVLRLASPYRCTAAPLHLAAAVCSGQWSGGERVPTLLPDGGSPESLSNNPFGPLSQLLPLSPFHSPP
ncbi:hypothetical protein QBC42DRAFT_89851 [Cladorrhinum samala]|uniref:Uncharacterized protein n=1 Tax=Cladorrhinum samala TaxID=585594 RepID=A0AAV9HPB9_9PEZI|nr:hypothetical protein QBC42DRAFT_89851 [Cladorrhinum samala]